MSASMSRSNASSGLHTGPCRNSSAVPTGSTRDRFDIEGSVEGTPTQDQMLEMLRSLLADRFKLAVHRETRQMPAYSLTLARGDGRIGRRASRRSSMHTTAGIAGLSGTAVRRIRGRGRFAERQRRDHDATRGGTTVSDGRTLRRRSNWSQRDVRREPDVERGRRSPPPRRRRRARRQSSRRFRSN